VLEDFVTGDLGPHNTLVVGDTVSGVIDLEASGRGDRVIDLVLLLRWVDSEALQERIFEVARQMGRPRQFELADVYWALNELNGAYASGDEHRIHQKIRQALDRINRRIA
jgi:aminoglycoside phosphotransferase (APT) family kinase protein